MDNRALWILLLNVLLADTSMHQFVLPSASGIDDIFLRLFNRDGTYIDQNVRSAGQLIDNMNTTVNTTLFVHGYTENINFDDVEKITGALLEYTDDNVLAMDYRRLAAKIYTTSVLYTGPIAAAVAKSLNSMIDAGLDPMKLHIIGHSLGAHIAGNIGRNLKTKIRRITALDAAGPLFYIIGTRLKPTDAQFVDAIYTDSGFFGTLRSVGTVNFYPDFGHRLQPGCSSLSLISFCSHHRSYKLYAESIKRPDLFVALKCRNSINYKSGRCNNKKITLMGHGTPSDVSGSYYLTTSAEKPYGRGIRGALYGN